MVKTVGANGMEETRVLPFTAEIVNLPNDRVRQVKITSFGISNRADGFDLGMRAEDIVAMPAQCHAVMIVRSEQEAEAATKLAGLVNESCVMRQ